MSGTAVHVRVKVVPDMDPDIFVWVVTGAFARKMLKVRVQLVASPASISTASHSPKIGVQGDHEPTLGGAGRAGGGAGGDDEPELYV